MPNNIIIRSLEEEDASNIHAVALEAWIYTYRLIFESQFIEEFVGKNYSPKAILSLFPRLKSQTMSFDVAERESKIIGFCNIGIHEQTAELYRIYLLPNYIGQGIGQRLLQHGEKFIAEKNINSYHCFVHSKNEIGKGFYLRSGLQHVPEKDQTDEWFMEKNFLIRK